MSLASALYAFGARARRRAWDRRGRRRLRRPVVSVGNLCVGGSGKTPVVAHLARILAGMGERPAVLSRGYGRQRPAEGVVVVSDGVEVRASLDRSGDEPLMLARELPGLPVLVAPDRHAAGRLAERRLGATVHLLDDGFQHLPLARDVDLLIVSAADLADPRTLPAGRLREPIDVARGADALLVPDADADQAQALGERLGVPRVFVLTRRTGALRWVGEDTRAWPLDAGATVLAVAGIARPERFFADVTDAGVALAGVLAFPDHHPYRASDAARILAEARQAGAAAVVTTAKDLVRLEPWLPLGLPCGWLPLDVRVEPAEPFQEWLRGRLRGAAGAAAGRVA